jgi:uncharacterized iron-regulated protein
MKRILFCSSMVFFMVISFAAQAHDVRQHRILRVSDRAEIGMAEMVKDLKSVPFVFVGERHNEKGHHEAQLAVIQALFEAGVPLAVGMEMFRRGSQADLDRWVAGELTEEDFEKIYYENWSSEWYLYRDIFLYGREKRIPMIGLNISPEITRQVAAMGFDSLTAEQVGQLPPVTCEVDAQYMSFIRRSFGVHGHSQERSFIHFCEAQMLWDASMAWHLLSFHKKNPRQAVVVLAGSGHAWKRGIPEQVRRQSQSSYRVVLPEIPERAEKSTVTVEDADYVWLGL